MLFERGGKNVTCSEYQSVALMGGFSNDECAEAIYLGVNLCGCNQTFDFCQICEDGSVPPDLSFQPVPFQDCLFIASRAIGVDYAFDSFLIDDDDVVDVEFVGYILSSDSLCAAIQASYGENCGCNNAMASEGTCRICNGTAPVSRPGDVALEALFIDGTVFCGDLEFWASFPDIKGSDCEKFQFVGSESCC